MHDAKAVRSVGARSVLDTGAVDGLRSRLRGPLCLPGEAGYEAARTLWNARIDKRPALVVRAVGAADVAEAVRFAAAHNLLLAIRGGGHNIAGNAVCDDGMMIDLSLMKAIRVDPAARTARAEPGVTLGEFDRETQAFGLATPLGINSTTGIAGLTLGGGFGWLSRKFGLTVDNLVSADVVTADGNLVQANARTNADLFWALRGGGGNFGVVTSFEFTLHPVGPQVLSGLIVYPLSAAKEVFDGYRRITARATNDLTCWVVMRKAPPLPFLPPESHGTEVMVLAFCYAGDPDEGRKAVAPLQALGQPLGTHLGVNPYAGWQTAFDPLLTPGAFNYWKSHDFTSISDETFGLLVEAARHLPSPHTEIFIGHLGGAINTVAPTATAYPHREALYVLNLHGRWTDPAEDASGVAWVRDVFEKVAPRATGGVYVNFMPEDEAARVTTGAYGPNYARLAKIKSKFDPGNLFRVNQNIRPA